MKKLGLPLGVRTPEQLAAANRRADRLRRDTNNALAAMRRGAYLHRHHEYGRALWSLSTGQFVRPEVAAVLIASPDITSLGDNLFRNMPGQSWRLFQ